MKIREVFPIIESCEAWLSQGRTGNDWGRRMRFASFIDEVETYREKAEKWDKIVKAFPESRLRMLLDILESDLQSSASKANMEES